MAVDPRERRRSAAEAFQAYLQRRARGGAESPDAFLLANEDLYDLLEPMVRDLSERSAGATPPPSASSRRENESSASSMSVASPHAPHASHEPGAPAAADVGGEVLGDFRILREVGRGGMGVVYEAEQISLGRIVALKVLPAHLTLRREVIERFRREAATVAKLRHPGIVEVYAIGEAGGAHFFAMEFIEGTPLDRVIELILTKSPAEMSGTRFEAIVSSAAHRRARASTGTLPDEPHSEAPAPVWSRTYVETVCQLIAQVADALEHAHRAGVIHRDVKPANILVRADGSTVLTDFGLARDEGTSSMTLTGEFAGTPYYVSPEQAMARRAKVDHRTDIYSLGVTLFELLTRKRPFEGRTPQEVLGAIVAKEPPSPRKLNPLLPRDLVTITLKAIERDPDRRYASAAAFAADLRAFLAFRPITARPATVGTRLAKLARRNRAATAAAASAALLGVALVVGWWLRPGEIVIESPTAGATVFVDDEARGVVPLRLNVAPGVHRVRLEKPDEQLASAEEQVVVARGATQSLSRVLASRNGVVQLESDPAGARVTLLGDGGKSIDVPQKTPALFVALEGRYRARFELPGFEPREEPITVQPGGVRTSCSTRWDTGELLVDGIQLGAMIDVYRGETCGGGAPVATVSLPQTTPLHLATGTYALRARLLGHERRDLQREQAARVEKGRLTHVGLWLAPVEAHELLGAREPFIDLVARDVDGDGRDELLVATQPPRAGIPWGVVRVLGADGRMRAMLPALALMNHVYVAWTDHAAGKAIAVGITPMPQIARMPLDGSAAATTSLDLAVECSAVGDLDHDGRDEIVVGGDSFEGLVTVALQKDSLDVRRVGTTGRVAVYGAEGGQRFERGTDREVASVAVADLDGDGSGVVIAGTESGEVVAWSADGSPRFRATAGDNEKVLELIALDLDGDGRRSVVARTIGRIAAFGPDGKSRFEWRPSGQIRFVVRASVGAGVEVGRKSEPVVGTSAGEVACIARDGTQRFTATVKGEVSALLAADVGSDSPPEIVVGTSLGKVVALSRTGAPLWETQAAGAVVRLLALDLDGDGRAEIVAGTSSGQVLALKDDGSTLFESVADGEIARLLTADLTGDGSRALVIATTTGQVVAFAVDRTRRFEARLQSEPARIAIAELDATRRPTLISASKAGEFTELGHDSSVRFRDRLEGSVTSLLVADLDHDGVGEVIAATAEGRIVVRDASGAVRFDVNVGRLNPLVAVGDLDGDGKLEVVATAAPDGIVAFAADGSRRLEAKSGAKDSVRQLVVADLDGDGRAEIVVGTEDGNVIALAGDGSRRFECKVPGVVTNLVAADLDGGPARDVVVVSALRVVIAVETRVTVLRADGSIRFQSKLNGQLRGGVLATDLGGDKGRAIVVAAGWPDMSPIQLGSGHAVEFAPDGKRRFRVEVPGDVSAIAVGDGDLALVVGSGSGRVVGYRDDGSTRFTAIADGAVLALRRMHIARDEPPCIVVATKGGQVLGLDHEGDRVFERRTKGVLTNLEIVDLDGDGIDEIVTWDHLGNVTAWASPAGDPRPGLRRVFLEGLAAAERGDESTATARFQRSGLRWLDLDDSVLPDVRRRLFAARGSAVARREAADLERVRPLTPTEFTKTIKSLVESERYNDATTFVRELGARSATGDAAVEAQKLAKSLLLDSDHGPTHVELALWLAEAAVSGDGRRSASYLDTLADAKLAAGDVTAAIALKKEALEKCPADSAFFRDELRQSIDALSHR